MITLLLAIGHSLLLPITSVLPSLPTYAAEAAKGAAQAEGLSLTPMDGGRSTNETAQLAARLTLLALAASLPAKDTVDVNRAIILPDSAVLGADEAAAILARMPLPLECSAENRSGVLAVRCRGISEPDHLFPLGTQVRSVDERYGVVGSILRENAGDHDNRTVLVLGRAQRLQVPLTALEYWWRNYLITDSLLLGGRPPNEEDEQERASGAVSVVVAQRSEDPYRRD